MTKAEKENLRELRDMMRGYRIGATRPNDRDVIALPMFHEGEIAVLDTIEKWMDERGFTSVKS